MVGGALMQLVAYGAQDIYLDGPGYTHSNAYASHEYYHAICKREKKQNNVISHKNKQYGTPRQLKKGTECIISLDEIKEKEAYSICTTCKQIFSWGHIILWTQNHNTCPHCRCETNITNMKKYINTTESKKKTEKKSK